MSELNKMYYSMGEVSEMLDVAPSLLRFWEKEFDVIRPRRNGKMNRMYTKRDIDNIKLIYHFTKEMGMTIQGAKKALKDKKRTEKEVDGKVALLESLQNIKSLLLEVKQGLGEDIVDAPVEEPAVSLPEEKAAEVISQEEQPVIDVQPKIEREPIPEALFEQKPAEKKKPQEKKAVRYVEQSLFDF